MIYYLPERIYNELKNDDEVIESLLAIEEQFDKYETFKDYIQGYSKLTIEPDTRELYIRTNNLIKNKLHGKKFLSLQFDINNGDVSLDELKKLLSYGSEKNAIDLENRFYLLSNICNQTEDHEEYELYLTKYVELYENFAHEVINLSKYIHLKYLYSYIYNKAMKMNTLDSYYTNWDAMFIDSIDSLYVDTENFVDDKDITRNYYIEALTTGMKRLNFEREKLGINNDLSWLTKFIDYEREIVDYQYENFSMGHLMFLDEVATLYCLEKYNTEFNTILDKIVDYINRALSDNKKLLRGLKYYDKVNHNMFALIIRKYLKVLAGIMTNLKINGLSDDDRSYILSDEITTISANTPNMIQEKRTKESVDKTADAMIRKKLNID